MSGGKTFLWVFFLIFQTFISVCSCVFRSCLAADGICLPRPHVEGAGQEAVLNRLKTRILDFI